MEKGYKILGNYIRLVDERNKNLAVTKLLGVSISKKFIPSIANIVGTDLSNYKIVRTGQFAYGPVTSRNGEKISIAYLDEEDCIISSSYTVFEVENKEELDPEYLMLWFSRPEFDRYARYKSHGSVREIFDWNELCMVELPVPDIEKQRKIVKAYKTITDRIDLKQKINDNLEAQANAIFSSSAPDFTDLQPIHNFGMVITGKTPPTSVAEYYGNDIPFIKTPDMHGNVYITSSECSLSKAGADSQKNKYIPENTVVVACIGANAGEVALTSYIAQTNQQINAVISKYPCFLYFSIKAHTAELRTLGEGSSTMININKTSFEKYEIPTPSDNTLQQLEHKLSIVFSTILHNLQEIDRLNETKDLLVTQLSH
ncbi:TPA: restriction endonuclease subunit S [Streptococcus suis]|nr:restriction endonuclease subunit S [Streptococcus suis]HEM5638584.1 restriction endonuclease subunit S [Streptococcus suis]